MHKFVFSEIKNQTLEIDKLEVHSFEMNVYLVKLKLNDIYGFVYDNQDKPMRFHSSQEIRDVFEHCQIGKAIMLHDSPYDEMIGNPTKPERGDEIPFSMQQPY